MRLYAIRNIFQSTHPVRGATFTEQARSVIIYISIHAPRAGCDILEGIEYATESISIHAPRAGCDAVILAFTRLLFYFNPRTPCGVRPCLNEPQQSTETFQSTHPVRGATISQIPTVPTALFQSTHPVRGATASRLTILSSVSDFNPRTPCGVRRNHARAGRGNAVISIHAPRAGCDSSSKPQARLLFISIHAPRAGCDFALHASACALPHFNPRTPCGVRLGGYVTKVGADFISIHAPRAGCDQRAADSRRPRHISIHAPRAGCDFRHTAAQILSANFNPRTPCGVRRQHTRRRHL